MSTAGTLRQTRGSIFPHPRQVGKPSLARLQVHLLVAAIVLLVTGLRVVYLHSFCPYDLAPDEAHYWDWSRHLDWSYYSKGPLVAWLIRASCTLFGETMPAVRLPAVLCGGLTLLGLYVLTLQVYRRPPLALAVVVAGLTFPVLAAGSLLMTIDAPLVCVWTWSLVFAHRAVFVNAFWAWAAAGACVALGILAKPTMVLWLPSFALFLLLTPAVRPLLRRAGFWLLCASGALGALQIVLWNIQHDWVTLRHTLGHAGVQHGQAIRWEGPAVYLGTQFALLLGFWFVAWVRAMWAHRPAQEADPSIRFLWWMSLPIVVFFGLFSLKNGGGQPNWPLVGYLAGMVLTAGWLVQELTHPRAWRRRLGQVSTACFGGLGLLLTILMHNTLWVQPLLCHVAWLRGDDSSSSIRRLDPTCRLRGWWFLAKEVDRIRAELRESGEEPVLAAGAWNLPGELGFYCAGQPTVYCLGPACGDRHSQNDLWRPNPIADSASFRGATFVVVNGNETVLRQAFVDVQSARIVPYCESGHEISRWRVTVCKGFLGFPGNGNERRY